MSIKERAIKNFEVKGYNCCQAVVCAYCDEMGIDDKDIFKLAEGFGGGMGGMQGVCGAVTGAFMAISMIGSAGDKADAGKTKVETYKNVRGLAAEFKQLRGSIDCRDLKVDRVACVKCVETGAELVEKFLEK